MIRQACVPSSYQPNLDRQVDSLANIRGNASSEWLSSLRERFASCIKIEQGVPEDRTWHSSQHLAVAASWNRGARSTASCGFPSNLSGTQSERTALQNKSSSPCVCLVQNILWSGCIMQSPVASTMVSPAARRPQEKK